MFTDFCEGFEFDAEAKANDGGGGDGAGADDASLVPLLKAKTKAKAKSRAVKEGEICPYCETQPRANVRKVGCVDCNKLEDNCEKDAIRNGEAEFWKDFKSKASSEQMRPLLFSWRTGVGTREKGKRSRPGKFPWSQMNEHFKVRKTIGKNISGAMKTYASFRKHYKDKGWLPDKIERHWNTRTADDKWKKGVDPEDTTSFN